MNDPRVEKQKPVPPFVQFCCAAIPQVFDDSLSYYEALCAMWKYLDETVKVINNNAMITEDFIFKVNELHDYVENYFANLDVQEEINNKLDAMAEDGTLQEIITTYMQANVAWTFDTVADMKLAENLIAGSYARTLGFHSLNDGGGATYYITDTGTANEMDVIAIDTLYANLVKPLVVSPKMYGAYGDGTHDDTAVIQYCINENSTITFTPATYLVSPSDTADDMNFYNAIVIGSNKIVDLNGSTLKLTAVDGAEKEKYCVVRIKECNNAILKNGFILGDREDHIGTVSEYGHGISCLRCTNSKIENVNVSKCTGDGIVLQAEFTSSEDYICSSNHIEINNCEVSYCRRNGISNIGCDDLTVTGCYVHDISGTSPQACIDIEGNLNSREEYPKNTVIYNCRLINEGTSDRGLLVYDRSYDSKVFDCVISSVVYYGKCDIRNVVADTVKNYADDPVEIVDSRIADLWSTGAEFIANGCEIEKLTINKTSDRTSCTMKFNECLLKLVASSNNSPEYTLEFNKCRLEFDGLINFEGKTKYATFNGCIINTVQRIMSSKLTTLKMYNNIIHITSNSATGLVYDTGLTNIEIIGNTITGTHTTSFTGTMFNATTLASAVFIGNTCTEITTISSGTITSLVSKLNFQEALNQA